MDGRAKPGHDGGGQSMRELKRLLFRGSLVDFRRVCFAPVYVERMRSCPS